MMRSRNGPSLNRSSSTPLTLTGLEDACNRCPPICWKNAAWHKLCAGNRNREREWAIKLRAGELLRLSPERVGALLCEPNKSDPLYRALKKYLGGDGVLFARYFIKTGLLDDARAYWRLRFEHDWPPPISTAPPPPLDDKFPDAKVTAFALDEAGTTEVDDAFSVTEAGRRPQNRRPYRGGRAYPRRRH